eukprot:scaffold1386_cov342-Pavlova_lutheri.AAC.9
MESFSFYPSTCWSSLLPPTPCMPSAASFANLAWTGFHPDNQDYHLWPTCTCVRPSHLVHDVRAHGNAGMEGFAEGEREAVRGTAATAGERSHGTPVGPGSCLDEGSA